MTKLDELCDSTLEAQVFCIVAEQHLANALKDIRKSLEHIEAAYTKVQSISKESIVL